jgi:hypothetical protein
VLVVIVSMVVVSMVVVSMVVVSMVVMTVLAVPVIMVAVIMSSVTTVTTVTVSARLGSEHAARAQGQEVQQGADRAAEKRQCRDPPQPAVVALGGLHVSS